MMINELARFRAYADLIISRLMDIAISEPRAPSGKSFEMFWKQLRWLIIIPKSKDCHQTLRFPIAIL